MIGIPRSNSVGTVSQCLPNVADHMPNSEEAIRRGEYTVIRSLIRVLEVLASTLMFFLDDAKYVLFVLISLLASRVVLRGKDKWTKSLTSVPQCRYLFQAPQGSTCKKGQPQYPERGLVSHLKGVGIPRKNKKKKTP